MPDWVFEATCSKAMIGGAPAEQPVIVTVPVEDISNRNLAIVTGINEVMRLSAETDAKERPIPQAAIDYWVQCRSAGNKQLYEIQSELEQWGLSFIVKEQAGPAKDAPSPASKPSRPKASQPAEKGSSSLPDLHQMLTERLSLLQAQEKDLVKRIQQTQDEYDNVRDDIRQTSEMLLIYGKTAKRKKKNGTD